MKIELDGVVIIVGNYGSGKTEIAVNLAAHQKRAGKNVRIADLDLVNPYFRTREARNSLRALGVDVVIPDEAYLSADLPILSPKIAGMLKQGDGLVILDVGGDDVGATVLASLADVIEPDRVRMLQVVNPFRPYTDTVEGCIRIRRAIEAASRLPVTGMIGNANLIVETTKETLESGFAFMEKLSEESGLPTIFVTVPEPMMDQIDIGRLPWPVLTIIRQLVPPWIPAGKLSGQGGGAAG